MKFSVLVAILPEELEEKAIKSARETGAGGVTILNGRGIGQEAKKSFFGLTYEGSQSVLIFVLERKLSVAVMKNMTRDLDLKNHTKGVVFTLPLEHIAGMDIEQIHKFEQLMIDEI